MAEISEQERTKVIYKVTWVGFAVNFILSACKLIAGIYGKSAAMVADAVHSLSDFLTDLVVIVFVHLSAKPKDSDHDYGHGKYETLATVIIAVALLIVAGGIFYKAIVAIVQVWEGKVIPRPKSIALIAAGVSIVTKELLYWYTNFYAQRVNSLSLRANAWHHRSDALSSIGTLIGIGGAFFLGEKWRVLDPIAAIVVAILIIKVGYDLLKPAINELLEHSLSDEEEQEIEHIAMSDPRLSDLHNLKTRRIGNVIAIEMHVRVDPTMSIAEAHSITKEMEKNLKTRYGNATQVIIHVEPRKIPTLSD